MNINIYKAKSSLQEHNISNKIQFGHQITHDMSQNPNFPEPSPALTDVTTAT